MRLPSPGKLAFVGSLILFAVLYGIASQAFGWFPSSLVQRAWNQAEAVSPLSTHDVLGGSAQEMPFRKEQVYEESGVSRPSEGEAQDGLTLISTIWRDFGNRPGLKLIDRSGDVLHQWKIDPAEIFSRSDIRLGPINLRHRHLHGTHLFENGDVLVNADHTGLARLDACGRLVWKLAGGTDHSIARADDGTFWVPRVTHASHDVGDDVPSFPGLGRPGNQNTILNVSADGQILQEISVLEILYENGLAEHLMRYRPEKSGDDITHLNDIEPLPGSLADEYPMFEAGDLLLSLRDINLVMVADPDTREVKWHATGPFIRQHDPDFMGQGWIGVFDNRRDGTERGDLLGGSRIVALQPHTDSTRISFPTDRSDRFYTPIMGKWQLLENGNLLLTESVAGRVVEVDPAGRTVWEWVAEPYSDSTVAWVQEGTRYELTESQVSGWPCSPGDS